MSVSPSVRPSVSVSDRLSVGLYFYSPDSLSFVCLSVCVSTHLSVSQSVSIHLSHCLPVLFSVYSHHLPIPSLLLPPYPCPILTLFRSTPSLYPSPPPLSIYPLYPPPPFPAFPPFHSFPSPLSLYPSPLFSPFPLFPPSLPLPQVSAQRSCSRP